MARFAVLAALVLLAARRGDDPEITDLQVVEPDETSMVLSWIAPADTANDDLTVGEYEVRYSTSDFFTWDEMFQVKHYAAGVRTPDGPGGVPPGGEVRWTIIGLEPGQHYWFAVSPVIGGEAYLPSKPVGFSGTGGTTPSPSSTPKPAADSGDDSSSSDGGKRCSSYGSFALWPLVVGVAFFAGRRS